MVGKTVQKMMGIVKIRDTHPNVLVKPDVLFFRDLSNRTWHPEVGNFSVHEHQPPVAVDPQISWFNDREGRQFIEKSSMDFWKGAAVGATLFAPLTFMAGAVVDHFAFGTQSNSNGNQQDTAHADGSWLSMT